MHPIARRAYRVCAAAIAIALSTTSIAWAVPTTPATPGGGSGSPSAIPVPVDPGAEQFRNDLAEKQAKVDELRAQLDSLDRDLAIAAESYNGAQEELRTIRERLDMTHEDLGAASTALTEQQDLLDTRVESMYRNGQLSSAEILLDSKSITDFFARVEFIRTISSSDADLAKTLGVQRDQLAEKESQLKNAETEAQALEFSLKARKVEIQLRIADRQAMLASTQNDLLELLDSEAARRAGEELTLWRQIMAGANSAGVRVEPYSPVETALSYHGIPYVWAGASPKGFDCSGLTMYVYRQHGVDLPHHAASQYLLGEPVRAAALMPGDLVFFGSPVHHVGMYIGGGYFLHAPRTGDYVKVSKLADRRDFVGARRYTWRYRIGDPMGVSGVSLPSNLPGVR